MADTTVKAPPGPLQTERLPGGNRKLTRKLVVQLDDDTTISVPKDFETDFSSIPWFARSFIDWSRVDIAGVVHDFLYWCPQGGISRKRSDDLWRRIAAAGGYRANPLQQWLGWAGLRLFGWRAYRNAHKAREAGKGRKCEEGETFKPEEGA